MLLDNIVKHESNTKTENGIYKVFDTQRNKYLSVDSYKLSFAISHANISGLRYMALDNSIYTSNLGYQLPRNGTITCATLLCDSTSMQYTVHVRKNNLESDILNIQNNSGLKVLFQDDLNIDINQGDTIQVLFESDQTQKINYPTLILKICWR